MAGRNEARIFTSIWKDPAFRALNPDAQRMYLFLLSQPDLSYCGVISLRENRWARAAAGLTATEVSMALKALSEPIGEPFGEGFAQPFLVVDEDTEEVLIRSFIRRDELWKQPNLLKAAREAAGLVESREVLTAMLADLQRIPVSESSSALVRTLMAEFITQLTQASGNPSNDPSGKGSSKGSFDPSQERGGGNGSSEEGLLTPDSGAPDSSAQSPSASADAPGPQLVLVGAVDETQKAPAKKPRKATVRKADRTEFDDQADVLTNGYWDLYAVGSAQSWIGIRKLVLAALKNGTHRDHVAWAMDSIGKEHKPITAPILTIAIGDVMKAIAAKQGKAVPGAVDRKQQATNDLFDRAYQRALSKEREGA